MFELPDKLMSMTPEQLVKTIEKMDKDRLENAVMGLVSRCKALRANHPGLNATTELLNKVINQVVDVDVLNYRINTLQAQLSDTERRLERAEELYHEADDNCGRYLSQIDSLRAEIDELKARHPGGRRRTKTAAEHQAVLDYLDAGHTQKEAAQHFNMSTSTIYSILKQNGRVNPRK